MATRTFANINASGQWVADGTAAITGTGPAAASTPAVIGTITNIQRFEQLHIVLDLSNALAGGVCDYVLQRLLPNSATGWDDYVYFVQQSAGAAAVRAAELPIHHQSLAEAAAGVVLCWTPHDVNTDATIALTAGNGRHGHWGRSLRLVARSGASVSAGAVINLYVRAVGKE